MITTRRTREQVKGWTWLRLAAVYLAVVACATAFAATASAQTLLTTQTPVQTHVSDGASTNYELGMKFQSATAGQITAIRFWKDSNETGTGTHTGHIWSSTGQLLATAAFTGETASGWQQIALATPLAIAANITYVVSVNTKNTYYVDTTSGLASQIVNGSLRSVVGSNGVFGNPGQFPSSTFSNSNYFRDVVLATSSLSSLNLNPASLIGGGSSLGTVTLTTPAPTGGAVVTLVSGNAAAAVPASVTVPAGDLTASFPVITVAVATLTSAIITGNYNVTRSAALSVIPPSLTTLSISPGTVLAGVGSTGTVTLSSAAPASGAIVTLLSGDAAAIVPATVTVLGGATVANFPISTTGVGSVTVALISGSFNGTQSTTLTINPGQLSSVVLTPAEVVGGIPTTSTVTLTGPAPAGGAVIALSSDNAVAAVAPSVTVPAGALTANFPVSTSTVLAGALANISGTYLGTTQSAALTIDIAVLSSVSMNPASIAGGNASTGTVTLTGPAPAGGALVTLAADNPSVSALEGVYSSAGLPQAGAVDWSTLGPEYTSVNSGTVVPVTGQPGVNLTLTTGTGLPMVVLTNCATGGSCGWYGNFAPGASVLWTSGTYNYWWAPHGPITVTLSTPQRGIGMQFMADEVGAFTATICAYNSSDTLLGCVPFNGAASGAADGSAVFAGLYDDVAEIAKITIDDAGPLYPHDFAIGSIFVSGARRQMIPTSVLVPAGASSANFTAATGAVSAITTVHIAANYLAAASTTLTINPASLSTITFAPSSVIGGTSLIGTATLNGAAPAGGAIITLSADNPVTTGLQRVTSATAMPQEGSIDWASTGPDYSLINSGASIPVVGITGLNVTLSTAASQPMQIATNCPGPVDCSWAGNFAPGQRLLWSSGTSDQSGNWIGNAPMTIALSTPQRGVGFQFMADAYGPMTATLCAYNSANALLGCAPFSGNGTPYAEGTAAYAGLYDDTPEIAAVTVDVPEGVFPHDLAIGNIFVAAARRMVPASVKVESGASTVTFPVNTDIVTAVTTARITGEYLGTQSGTLKIYPQALPFSISGTVSLPGSSSGATVTLSGTASATTIADGAGYYVFAGLSNGSYTVTPSKAGFAFTPASHNVTVNNASAVGIDFAAPTHSISGTVSAGGQITLALTGIATASTTTNGAGAYTFTGLPNGNFTITPSSVGYDFYPGNRTVTVNGGDVAGVDFLSGPAGQTFSISGTVTSAGSGAVIMLIGTNTVTTTASSTGAYSLAGLAPGNYTVSPSKAGLVFSPGSRSVTLGPLDASAIDFTAAAFSSNLTVNGTQTFQTMNGAGVNLNVNSWNNGELKPALDMIIDANGAKVFRVIRDPMDWVGSESLIPLLHTLDPATLATVYEAPEMLELWNTLGYLNQRGVRGDQIVLNFMGWTPTWIGGSGGFDVASHITAGKEGEFATMVASLAYYGRRVKNLDFTMVAPTNESDQSSACLEGPCVGANQYATVLHDLVAELDLMGLTDMRIVAPDTAGSPTNYISALMADSSVAARIDHLSYHSYGAAVTPGAAYPPRTYWVTETGANCQDCDTAGTPSQGEWAFARETTNLILQDIANGFTSALVWEAYDSFYFHHNSYGFWGLLSYNQTTGAYTPRKRFYANAQVNSFVYPGSVRIGQSNSVSGLGTVVSFYDAATGKFSMVGQNSGGSPVTIRGQLLTLPPVNSLAVYITNSGSSTNLQRTDVPISGNTFTVTIPADSFFSLSN